MSLSKRNIEKLIGMLQWQYHKDSTNWTISDGKMLMKLYDELRIVSREERLASESKKKGLLSKIFN